MRSYNTMYEALAALSNATTGRRLPPQAERAYAEALDGLDVSSVSAACRELSRTASRLPSAGDVRAAALEVQRAHGARIALKAPDTRRATPDVAAQCMEAMALFGGPLMRHSAFEGHVNARLHFMVTDDPVSLPDPMALGPVTRRLVADHIEWLLPRLGPDDPRAEMLRAYGEALSHTDAPEPGGVKNLHAQGVTSPVKWGQESPSS